MLSKQAQSFIQIAFKKLTKASIKTLKNDQGGAAKQSKISSRIELAQSFFNEVSKHHENKSGFDIFILRAACAKITGYGNEDDVLSLWLVYFFKQLVLWSHDSSTMGARAWPCFVAVVRKNGELMLLVCEKPFNAQVKDTINLDELDDVYVIDPLRYPGKIQTLDDHDFMRSEPSTSTNFAEFVFVPNMQQWLSDESLSQSNQLLELVKNKYPVWMKNNQPNINAHPILIDQDQYLDEHDEIETQVGELFFSKGKQNDATMTASLDRLKKPLSQIKTTSTPFVEGVINKLKKLRDKD